MQHVVERIKTLMEKEGLSPAEFADTIGIGRPLLSHVLGGRNNPSLQLVIKILECFPAYSADWLINGKTQSRSETVAGQQAETEIKTLAEKPGSIPFQEKSVSKSAVSRALLFYSDGTFEAYNPRK